MQPSSLIFLVIIAIWAAYFLQYWVRRREHLATARSVDRFSESMRVLERRSALPEPNLSVPQPRSYAVSPARASRPQVVVKRAATAPAVEERRRAASSSDQHPSASGREGSGPVGSVPVGARAAASRAALSRLLPSGRRLRGLVFLATVTALPVLAVLAALGLVPWLVVPAPLALLAGVVLWMARATAAERRRGAAERRTDGAERRSNGAQRSTSGVPGQGDSALSTSSTPEPARGQLYDLEVVEAAAHVVVAEQPAAPVPLVDEDDIPLTWDPVPVPRPTYTMKARAQRPAPAPAEVTPAVGASAAAYEEPVRRVAGA